MAQAREYNRATIGDVLRVMDERASNVKESTAKNYRRSLLLLVREVTGATEFGAMKTKLSVLRDRAASEVAITTRNRASFRSM